MSLKAELEIWAAALKAYDEGDFEKSLDLFSVRAVAYSIFRDATCHLISVMATLCATMNSVSQIPLRFLRI